MAELRALCAGCRKPLSGQLLVNSCNHVFHAHCLSSGICCGRCEHPLQPEKALSLFGLGFEEVDDAMSVNLMAAMAQLKGDNSEEDEALQPHENGEAAEAQDLGPTVLDSDSQEVPAKEGTAATQLDTQIPSQATASMSEAARILMLRQRSRRSEKTIEADRGEVLKSREYLAEQQKKFHDSEKLKKKVDSECSEIANAILQSQASKENMMVKINQLRQRDAALDYWEELRQGDPDSALGSLTMTVAIVGNPWKVLTQVARLRDHHRKKLASWEKDIAQASRREQRARLDRDAQMKVVSDLKAKIQQQK
eukprot:CAMPEP_0197625304 /NCGR_PEP_ID=MMETSP1338-20131121/4701_1 /TAXON_ID=43686 ORGANISM="Pelagodinium beii, Strain RCC1491" /NCGR_SAMPLE_ID=MMETSP1338 /ASSEMBLY_ACC=CAM_ASM_000754 /LENGTH=308 /DNA_ID=CAMNT_0043195675 /DNA_START=81 /DNA_END=1004 /DNA_ORIENTATION=+